MKNDKLKIKQAVIVEGNCDRAVLESVIDAVIIPVNGFGIYKDKQKLALIRRYAETDGIILLTDSDNAGRQIRDYLKNRLNGCKIEHLYVPNMLEVEDTETDILRKIFAEFDVRRAEVTEISEPAETYSRQRLFEDGFIGGDDSSKKRKELLRQMNLPENLSVTALLDVLNRCGTQEYEEYTKDIQ
ncbi:MAG: DUF4093 domain-containing protein [Oscillospiraceae bacterium]|nr:DUF4093 domain-containing protein [Oscillospiraceae bacterium]